MSKKYELTDETTTCYGETFHRIRATEGIPAQGVTKGDLGGWVTRDVMIADNAWVADNAHVFGNVGVFGNAIVYGNAHVHGNAHVQGNAHVFGNARVSGDAWVQGDARVHGNARVSGDAYVQGDAHVFGNALINHTQDILVIHPVGSENVNVTAYRARDGHDVNVGCWTGTLTELPGEVKRRRDEYWHDSADADRWQAEYDAIIALLTPRAAWWEAGNNKTNNDR